MVATPASYCSEQTVFFNFESPVEGIGLPRCEPNTLDVSSESQHGSSPEPLAHGACQIHSQGPLPRLPAQCRSWCTTCQSAACTRSLSKAGSVSMLHVEMACCWHQLHDTCLCCEAKHHSGMPWCQAHTDGACCRTSSRLLVVQGLCCSLTRPLTVTGLGFISGRGPALGSAPGQSVARCCLT